MLAVLQYPKTQEQKGRISPYFKRLKIKTKKVTILEGSEESLAQLKEIAERNGGKIIFPVKIIT